METIWRGLCMDKETLWLCKQTNKNAPDLAHKYCHPSNKFSTSLSCQRWKHVNSCDIVMRWESLPSAPIRAPVSSPAAPAWLHLPAIMNCQHRSLPHLHRPFSLFSFVLVYLISISLLLPTQWHWYIWVLNTSKIRMALKNGKLSFNLVSKMRGKVKKEDWWFSPKNIFEVVKLSRKGNEQRNKMFIWKLWWDTSLSYAVCKVGNCTSGSRKVF